MSKKRSSSRNKPGNVTVQIWNVPGEVRARFKAACARKGVTMEDAVVSLLKQFAAGRITHESGQ